VLCFELTTMSAEDEHFEAKVTVLMENVTHHIDEEEQEWFPKVRENLGRNQLREIGARMQELRPNAPTKPSEPKALTKALDAMRA
jgi:hemerythrin-like domain-containing protein